MPVHHVTPVAAKLGSHYLGVAHANSDLSCLDLLMSLPAGKIGDLQCHGGLRRSEVSDAPYGLDLEYIQFA